MPNITNRQFGNVPYAIVRDARQPKQPEKQPDASKS